LLFFPCIGLRAAEIREERARKMSSESPPAPWVLGLCMPGVYEGSGRRRVHRGDLGRFRIVNKVVVYNLFPIRYCGLVPRSSSCLGITSSTWSTDSCVLVISHDILSSALPEPSPERSGVFASFKLASLSCFRFFTCNCILIFGCLTFLHSSCLSISNCPGVQYSLAGNHVQETGAPNWP
jgi:hypothetical protein